jgi:hypothetical protein
MEFITPYSVFKNKILNAPPGMWYLQHETHSQNSFGFCAADIQHM